MLLLQNGTKQMDYLYIAMFWKCSSLQNG